ncbi:MULTISPECIES: BTAD domain-containing putative transcriptional regulator [unclassified Streptomyces]|uniref:AfsR/SARP family transcriptional regulator n=1 Tax=unclassified Streptomyces TaxID=2593676 RepID=UPI00342B4B95
MEGWADGAKLRLGGTIQERVLVALLLEPGKMLPVSRLVTASWEEEPPATAAHQIRKAVADIRRRIPGGREIVVTEGPGYHVLVTDTQLDLTEFDTRLRTAKEAVAAGRSAQAVEALQTALALWRGPLLSGEGGPVLNTASTVLEERRLAAAEQLFDLRLGRGEAAELVGDLRGFVQQDPLRETLRGQLMLALYRSGRQAAALEEYAEVRKLLAEELGIDPGPQLAKMYEGILQESPEMAGVEQPSGAVPLPLPEPEEFKAPAMLPHDLADFTGRSRELQELLHYARGEDGQATRIVALDGMGGSGKTSLAVRAAHRLAAAYPDGQIHIDLRGYTPGEQPITTGAALDTLLQALGVPGHRIPEDVIGRAALWRATLIGKRLLLLVDNAADTASIRPLLPTSPGCLVLVTSRARLVDLDGAEWISIDIMAPEESAALVADTVGMRRVAAEPEAAAELARLCGHLPLALRIATARLRNRPRWTLAYLVDRLRDETRRLDELSSGERSVAATLRLSYQALDEESRTAFRILALHPGGDIDVHSAAALLGLGPRDAEDILERLLDVHLVQQPEIGLYTLHDLVRSFAQSLRGEPTARADEGALEQLLDYYLTATEAACEILFPGRRHRPTGILESTAELPDFKDVGHTQAWFTREHAALLSVVALAERLGYDRHAVCLTRNIVFQLNARGHLREFADLCRLAVTASRRLGDLALLGVSLSNLGVACWKLGRLDEGVTVVEEGRDVAARMGDRHTEAHSESTLGLYKSLLGRFPEALAHLQRAIACERELASPRAEAESLTALSALYEQWGRHHEAAEAARQAVELARQLDRRGIELVAHTDLAFAHIDLGEYAAADQALALARGLYDESMDQGHVAMALALSADVAQRLEQLEQSSGFAERALALVQAGSSPLRQAKVENVVGRVLQRRQEYASALDLHSSAYELASGVGYRTEEAYALAGMAEAAAALGAEREAAEHAAAAEELFAAMGVAREVRRS